MIQIQIGQCGNQVGLNYWDKLINEHKIGLDGFYTGNDQDEEKYLANSEFVFNVNQSDKKYVPRAILVDSESSVLDEIRQSRLSNLFRKSNILNENRGTGGLWATGRFELDSEFVDSIMESIRKEAESSDMVMFQFISAIGGGTGSGLGSLLIDRIRHLYPKNVISTFNLVPSPIQNGTVLDYYNSVLAIKSLSQNSNGCFFFDNQALRKICRNSLNIKSVNINHTNDLISKTILGLSGCQRLSNSKTKIELAKITEKLACTPQLHFYAPSINFLKSPNMSYEEIRSGPVDSLLSVSQDSKVFGAASIFQGSLHQQVDLNQLNDSLRWNSGNKICGACESNDGQNSVINVVNSKGLREFFDRLNANGLKSYRKRAFVMRYVFEGMDESELVECFEEVNKLKEEYDKELVEEQTRGRSGKGNNANVSHQTQPESVNSSKCCVIS